MISIPKITMMMIPTAPITLDDMRWSEAEVRLLIEEFNAVLLTFNSFLLISIDSLSEREAFVQMQWHDVRFIFRAVSNWWLAYVSTRLCSRHSAIRRWKMHLTTKKSISNVKLYNLPSSIYASEMSRKCIFIYKKAFKIFL